jgi:hypothetical protein
MGGGNSVDAIKLARFVSRRRFIQGSVGAVAGAGAALGPGLLRPIFADDESRRSTAVALPIPHRTFLPFGPTSVASVGVHFYFPGPVSGRAHPSDPTGPTGSPPSGNHPEGRDPAVITNFNGWIGQFDGTFEGTGRNTNTGATAHYKFHTDTRFVSGEFIGSDEHSHRGTLAFI